MSNTSASASVSSVPEDNVAAATKPVPKPSGKQRFKPQLSCTFCRGRKLKCDRNQPCDNCVKRDIAGDCTFIHAGIIRDKTTHVQKPGNASSSRDVQSRVKQLEDLVVSLMQQTATVQPKPSLPNASHPTTTSGKPPDIPVETTTYHTDSLPKEGNGLSQTFDSLGRISIEDEQPNYVGGSHWVAILDSIAGLKDSLEFNTWTKEDADMHNAPSNGGPDLLVGSVRKATRAELLGSIPPRSVVDMLVNHLLETDELSTTVIHRNTFQKEYSRFWADPDSCPIMWIGLLYAIMYLSANLQLMISHKSPGFLAGQPQRDPYEARALFQEKTIQCLVLGNYTEPPVYTVETLIVYCLGEHFQNPDAQVGSWMIVGLIVKAAMRLGFHRDASHYSNISTFRGEMQRRLWSIITHLDIATSSAIGLPRMIKEDMYDTQSPRNLYDEDFDEHVTELPPPRPNGVITPIGFVIVKDELILVSGMIVDQANSTKQISYEEITKLDKLLEDAYQNRIPEFMKVRTLEDLKTGDVEMRVRKFSVDLLYHKARCVLHRKFLIPPKSSTVPIYPYSTKSCVDSAMRILQSQMLLHLETRPGKPLHEHKWKTTSLMTQDFLLAAMLICLYLSHSSSETFAAASATQNEFPISWSKDEMLQALDDSFLIWDSSKCASKEALKAARALKAMLIRIRNAEPTAVVSQVLPQTVPVVSSGPIYSNPGFSLYSINASPDNSIPTTNSSPWPSNSSNPGHTLSNGPTSYPVIDNMMNDPLELNWEMWDNHFQNNNLGDAPADLWNFSNNAFPLTDPNHNILDWGQ